MDVCVQKRTPLTDFVKDHGHFPELTDTEKRKFRKTLKDRAAVLDVLPRQTIFAAQHYVNRERFVRSPSQVTLLTNKLFKEIVTKQEQEKS